MSDQFNFDVDMTEEQSIQKEVIANKQLRNDLDAVLQNLKSCPKSRERILSITKLQEAIMWLGMDLKRLNDGVTCYPKSYDTSTDEIEQTADGLKF